MVTSTIRIGVVSASIALFALSSPPAAAELPSHLPVAGFGPAGTDFDDPETDGFELRFGDAVAIRDGIAFMGIPIAHQTGRVAVFNQMVNQTASSWQRVQTLAAPTPVPDDKFGRTIAFRGGWAIIGSRTAAYLFKRSNGVWKHWQTLRPPAADGTTLFPVALRYEAGTLLASAYRGDTLPSQVYVFELEANGKFSLRTRLKALDAQPGDNFGSSLSMTDTTLVMGSPCGGRDRSFNLPVLCGRPGAAYVFKRNSLGNWVQTQKLVTAEPASGFGVSVAIDQGMIIVGAPIVDWEGGIHAAPTPDDHVAGGAAFGFLPVAGRYLETFKLRPRPDEKFSYVEFGYQVAMFGNHIVISAAEDFGAISAFPRGFVFVYRRDGASVTATGIADAHLVSSSIALANNLLLVGDPGDDRCIFGCPGAATLYDVSRFRQ